MSMKKNMMILSVAACATAMLAAACSNGDNVKLENRVDTLSWAMGENVGKTLLEGQVVELDYDVFMDAVRHTLDGKKQPLSDDAYNQTMQYIMMQAQMQQMQQAKQQRNDVSSAQDDYFKKLVASNPKVKKHPAGFYYEVMREGKGPKAQYAHSVSFDYRSYLMLTGEPYDQTYGKREPIAHVIGHPMFQGLVEGLQLMNAGSQYRFYFPYQLAFGEAGSGDIPGYTPFIYEVELHEILD